MAILQPKKKRTGRETSHAWHSHSLMMAYRQIINNDSIWVGQSGSRNVRFFEAYGYCHGQQQHHPVR